MITEHEFRGSDPRFCTFKYYQTPCGAQQAAHLYIGRVQEAETWENCFLAVTNAAIRQATRYGTQVRELEDAGNEIARRTIRKAWRQFRWQLDVMAVPDLSKRVHDAYWAAYCA